MVGIAKLMLVLSLGLGPVLAQPDTTTTAKTGCTKLTFTEDDLTGGYPNAVTRCSGKIQAKDTTGSYDICGVMTDIAAERACFEAGVNLDKTRRLKLARCEAHQLEAGASATTKMVKLQYAAGDPTEFNKKEQFHCIDQCMDLCYPDAFPAVVPAAVAFDDGDCEQMTEPAASVRLIIAAVCFDRDECNEGLLFNCTSAFDEDCVSGEPCADNTVCINTPEAYMCNCTAGYEAKEEGDEYLHLGDMDGAGCIDIDECEADTSPCAEGEACLNTKGSFICVGEAAITCGDPGDDPFATHPQTNGSDGTTVDYTCQDGYEYNNESTYTRTCEAGAWDLPEAACEAVDQCADSPCDINADCWSFLGIALCICADGYTGDGETCTAKPRPCGDPGDDPFASHPQTDGAHGALVLYTCHTGYSYGGAATYTRTCTDGTWDNQNAECAAVDQCVANPCDTNADCWSIRGEALCICMFGFTGNGFVCTRIDCGQHPTIVNAVGVPNTAADPRTVDYTCDKGYAVDHTFYNHWVPTSIPRFIESFRIYCARNGLWEPQPIPHCYPISCGDPGIVLNADRSASTFLFGDEVTYTCKEGYTSNEAENPTIFTSRCQDDGTWTTIHRCADINECQTSNSPPCGDSKHFCTNTDGGYRCSCAPGYRPSDTGRSCIPYPFPYGKYNWNDAPCDFYKSLGLCGSGTCSMDPKGYPYCVCKEGYSGSFCNEHSSWKTFEVLSVLGVVLSVISVLFILFLLICFCGPWARGRPNHPVVRPVNDRPYGIPDTL